MDGPSVKLLFLGAGKRLSLLERFQEAAVAESVHLSMWSIEDTGKVPIASISRIVLGPRFEDREFGSFLSAVAAEHKCDIVIPNMDSATVVLSKQKCVLARMECEAVVSDHELCLAMNDKVVAHTWFTAHKLPVPIGDAYPRIVKYRFGYGSKDQFIAHEPAELHQFLRRRSSAAYLDQPLLTGQEYTVDAYVDRSGRVLAALSRKRIKVSDGEVDVSLTHRHRSILELTRRVLAIPGWRGPITLQFIDAPQGPVLIEINPRFGGGVTHSIHCGLDMPRWIIREHLERPVAPCDDWPENSVMTRCRRDFFYDNISRP